MARTTTALAALTGLLLAAGVPAGPANGQDVPRKPPIDRIWFDAEDRLWVSLSVHGDAVMSEADVYDTTGALLFRAEWPQRVELRHGAARGTVAWGIAKGPLDEPRLALIRFGDQGSRQ